MDIHTRPSISYLHLSIQQIDSAHSLGAFQAQAVIDSFCAWPALWKEERQEMGLWVPCVFMA